MGDDLKGVKQSESDIDFKEGLSPNLDAKSLINQTRFLIKPYDKGVNEMANMFAELARQATILSPIIEGKTKISVGDIIENYPNGITVTDFDMVTSTDKDGNPDTYPVFVFAEDTSRFGFGGSVFKTICESWINHFDGDIETCSKALQAGGGVKMIFSQARTKAGRSVTTIKVVG